MVSDLERIAPGLLIAAPALRDPNFDRTVVLMCVHNAEGAMGLVINRPATVTMSDILEQLELEVVKRQPQLLMVGGPVAMQSAMMLYRCETSDDEPERDDELRVANDLLLRLNPGQEQLAEIARGDGPEHYHLFLGHSGWGPGQLEQEMAMGAWLPARMHAHLLFDTDVEQRWDRALEAEGLHPVALAGFKPSN